MVGILDEHCCHRQVSLVIGRCEGNGIRCLFHGWKFAVDGTVMETPNVPDPAFKTRVKAKAYPVREKGGLIWAYLGPPELEPAFPHYPWFDVPDSNRINAYAVDNCNYVQVFEALVNSSHLNILHTDGLGASKKLENLNFAAAADMAFDAGPRIEVDDTDFGFHYAALRGGEAPGQETHVRITAVTAPFFVANPNEDLWMCVVPINDYQCVHFHVFFHPERRMNEEPLRSNMLKHVGLDDEALRNYNMTYDTVAAPGGPDRRNHFLQNRASLKQGKFSGFHSFTQEDAAVVMSAGPIKDRTQETLGPSRRRGHALLPHDDSDGEIGRGRRIADRRRRRSPSHTGPQRNPPARGGLARARAAASRDQPLARGARDRGHSLLKRRGGRLCRRGETSLDLEPAIRRPSRLPVARGAAVSCERRVERSARANRLRRVDRLCRCARPVVCEPAAIDAGSPCGAHP